MSCFRSGWRALVEILVSHLSAQDAERWGTRLLGWGEIEWGGIEGDTGSLDCARDDRLFRVCTSEDARAFIVWRGLVQRSFVGSRVCATPLPQDDSGRLACPWAFSRVGSSISGSGWPCLVSEVDGVRLSRFSVPTFPHRTRKDGAPACLAGVRLRGAASWETQGPSAALGMTDLLEAARASTLGPTLIGGASCRDPSLGVACARLRFLRMTAGGWTTLGLFQGWVVQSWEATGLVLFQKWMACAGRDSRFPPFRTGREKMGHPLAWLG